MKWFGQRSRANPNGDNFFGQPMLINHLTPASLNTASVSGATSRSAYGGATFTLLNNQAGAAGPQSDDLNSAAIPSRQMLAGLNHQRIASQLASAVAALNQAHKNDAESTQAQAVADKRQTELTQQAQKLVSQTFFGTMLKQMRNSPFKSELFSGGRGGEMFTSLLDQHLSERLTHGSGQQLVQSIVKQLEKIKTGDNRPMVDRSSAQGVLPKAANTFADVRIHVAPSIGN